jgi:hypothetical protein
MPQFTSTQHNNKGKKIKKELLPVLFSRSLFKIDITSPLNV